MTARTGVVVLQGLQIPSWALCSRLGETCGVPILAKGDFAKESFAEPQFPLLQKKQNTLLQAASEQQSLAVGGEQLPHLLVLRPPAFKEKDQLVLAVRGLLSPQRVLRKQTSLFSAP